VRNPYSFKVGDKVYDDLTRAEATIIGKQTSEGVCDNKAYHGVVVGYWLDNEWVGGGRHPWEISSLDKEGNA
jgi:hypothetical protein